MSVSKPLVLATVMLNGVEILKKPVHAGTIEELQREARGVCPSLGTSKLLRVLVYDKAFEEYIDVDARDHSPSSLEKFLLRFSSTSTSSSSHCSTCRASSQAQSSSGPTGTQKDNPNNKIIEQRVRATQKNTKGRRKSRNNPPVQSSLDDTSVTDEEGLMKHTSQIFGRYGGTDRLNRYQQHINEQAFLLAKAQPALLEDRNRLLTAARKALHDSGYNYARGNKTRSKVLVTQAGGEPYRYLKTYSRAKERKARLEEIAEQTRSLEVQMEFLRKGKEAASGLQKFDEAAAFEQQSEGLRCDLNKLDNEKIAIFRKTRSLLRKKIQRETKAVKQGSKPETSTE